MRKGAIVAIIIIAVVVIGGVAGIIVYNNMNNDSGTTTQTADTTQTTQKQSSSGLDLAIEDNDELQVVHKTSITMPGWTKLEIPANQTEVTVDFYNPSKNEGLCYMTFELKLKDTGETICSQTGLIKPGDHKRNITLTRPLEKGTYNAVLHIQPYSLDDSRSALNSADVELQLVVT